MLRRSIFAKKRINKNDKFTKMNIDTFRPKIGIGAENYFKIIGKKSKKSINKFDPIFKSSVVFQNYYENKKDNYNSQRRSNRKKSFKFLLKKERVQDHQIT